MKLAVLFLFPVVLSACTLVPTDSVDSEPVKAPTTIDAQAAGGQPIAPEQLARLGDACGPSTDKICASGLTCQFEGEQPQSGKCLPTVVNPELECDDTQAPVCGLLGNNKNGYLNECYARRYGAVVVSEGFCQPDPNVAGNCQARAYSLGNCQKPFTGARFNPQTNTCEAITLIGCEADIPFTSLDECRATCS